MAICQPSIWHTLVPTTDRLMFIAFTSGTTGQRKRCRVTRPVLEGHHYFIVAVQSDDAVLHHIRTWADHKADVWHPCFRVRR